MKQTKILYISILFATIVWSCKPAFYNQITVAELEESINFLASDSLKGRFPGTIEDSILTAYILEKMDISGMLLLGDNGYQEVSVEEGFTVTANNRIITSNKVVSVSENLKVLGFSATDTIQGDAILISDPDKIQTFNSGSIIILSYPEDLPGNSYDAYGDLRTKSLKLADKGASALIYLYDESISIPENSKRISLQIPVVAISIIDASNLLNSNPDNVRAALINQDEITFDTGISLRLETEVIPSHIKTYNTISKLKGINSELSDQYIIIGAHHDHLGLGGRGSSSRRQDTVAIHYGADDNASGVAGVLELSQNLLSRSPERSIIFTTFAAEEMGLFGSKTFAANPPIDLKQVQVMINLDMIGRLNEDRQLQIGGVGTSPIFKDLLDTINKEYNFNIAFSNAGYGPSDHSSFYAKDIPVLFISTGAHPDYHTPSDTPDKINYTGMEEVLCFVSDLAYTLANLPDKIEFTEAGPKESAGSRGRMGMVTFGLMPDVMYDGNEGMPVSFVTEGKPAAIGGMKGGDIITAVDGKTVGNVQDYMARLSDLKEGQSVVVSVKRDGKQIELLLKL